VVGIRAPPLSRSRPLMHGRPKAPGLVRPGLGQWTGRSLIMSAVAAENRARGCGRGNPRTRRACTVTDTETREPRSARHWFQQRQRPRATRPTAPVVTPNPSGARSWARIRSGVPLGSERLRTRGRSIRIIPNGRALTATTNHCTLIRCESLVGSREAPGLSFTAFELSTPARAATGCLSPLVYCACFSPWQPDNLVMRSAGQ
jgi:hypothetical protein